MAAFSPFIKSLSVVILFTLFMYLFIGQFLVSTNSTSPLITESKYGINSSISRLNTQLINFNNTISSAKTKLGKAEPSIVDYFLVFKDAFFIPLSFLTLAVSGIGTLTNIIFISLTGTGLSSALSIVLGVIISGLIFTIVLLIIKLIRTGESER